MSSPEQRRDEEPLFVLAGPTASGKSALALRVARSAGAELVSMDSMLVYRGMDIGTAKPTPSERAAVRHHLLDLVDPWELFTVQAWLAGAERAQAEIRSRSQRALFVGGTAFYLKALLFGLFAGPDVDPALRADLERRHESEGAEALYAELARVDPQSAARLHPRDKRRVVRALEVWHQTGQPLSSWQREWGFAATADAAPPRRSRIVALSPPGVSLESRIQARVGSMLDAGWVEEVRAIRSRGGFSRTALQALGYREALALADGLLTRTEAEERIALRTRQFARKQRTWLRQFRERVEVSVPGDLGPAEGDADMERATREILVALRW